MGLRHSQPLACLDNCDPLGKGGVRKGIGYLTILIEPWIHFYASGRSSTEVTSLATKTALDLQTGELHVSKESNRGTEAYGCWDFSIDHHKSVHCGFTFVV